MSFLLFFQFLSCYVFNQKFKCSLAEKFSNWAKFKLTEIKFFFNSPVTRVQLLLSTLSLCKVENESHPRHYVVGVSFYVTRFKWIKSWSGWLHNWSYDVMVTWGSFSDEIKTPHFSQLVKCQVIIWNDWDVAVMPNCDWM